MGRPRKYQRIHLQREASGNWFRHWLQDVLHYAPGELGPLSWTIEGKPSAASVNFLVDRTNLDQRQLRTYLSSDGSKSGQPRSKGNPKVETAVQIARGIRDLSPYASPLCMLYRVPRFTPHAWGVIGTICAPGPTEEIMAIWPALQWMIRPQVTIQEEAFKILLDDAFHATFDDAWDAWNNLNSTSGFPDALHDAIEHARNTQHEMWYLCDSKIEAWADWVTRDPKAFGLGMRMLEGRSLFARGVFERELERWNTDKGINGDIILTHYPYLCSLIESEQSYLRSRVKAIFESHEHWRAFADLF